MRHTVLGAWFVAVGGCLLSVLFGVVCCGRRHDFSLSVVVDVVVVDVVVVVVVVVVAVADVCCCRLPLVVVVGCR
jgi:hypothetical protein